MEKLTKEQFNEIISKYKNSFYIICAGNGVLKNNECAGYIAISEETAKNYFDSIVNYLPENMRKFSTMKFSNVENIYSFCGLFNRSSFKYINLVDFGIVEKSNFIKKNMDNVEYIYKRLKGFKDNDLIYSIYTKEGKAFSPTAVFRQCFFSTNTEIKQFIEQYNNEELGLYGAWFEIDELANNGLNDLLDCCFDGRECSGWDIVEAVCRIYDENSLNAEEIQKIVSNKKLSILGAIDGSNYVMMQRYNAIFFTSNEKAERFLERSKSNITHEFRLLTVEKIEGFNKLISDSRVVYIDGEKHSTPINFLRGVELGFKNSERERNEVQEEKQLGWDAITNECERVYPNQKNPKHYGTLVSWKMGGNDPLEGISVYDGGDYWHFVTYGLSELNEKVTDNKDISGYGMEFTFKLKKDNYENEEAEIKGICGILQFIARITFTSGELFNAYEYLYTGQTEGIDSKMQSNITGFITIPDNNLKSINTPNGKVDFVELIGVTNNELLALKNKEIDVRKLYKRIGSDITDYNRQSVI